MTRRVLADDGHAVVLAADHRARGIVTVERYADYLAALRTALPACDSVMASAQPLADLAPDATGAGQATLLSLNRTGLAGTAFELDDRLVASVERAADEGYTGVKVMTRVDRTDAGGAAQLEMLGRVLEEARSARLACLVEPLTWTDGQMDRTVDGIIWAAVVAHDMGAPLLKVPVPDISPGAERVVAVQRIVGSVGVPVLFLGGPRVSDRETVLAEVTDVMAGGGAGMAIGRAVYQDPDPARIAKDIAALVHPVNALAIDLGTSAVKAIVWNPEDGVIARGRAVVATAHPASGYDEQVADDWWAGVQDAIDDLPLDDLTGIGLSSQRETFVCLDEDHQPLRPAILWSDGRAPTPAARFDWLREHEPDVVRRTRWLAAPKDYVLHRLVGRLVTDTTLASRTDVDPGLLPEVVEPRTVVGEFRGAPVLVGAGDRACEVYAVGAKTDQPMVSWGTTANCSLPLDGDLPTGWRASLDVAGQQLAEAGLSAAGSAIGWLADLTSLAADQLTKLAAAAPPGAHGVIALPWLNGARAPWWRPEARATLLGVTAATTAGDLARAVYEGVAHDVRRALAMLSTQPKRLHLAGAGSEDPVWPEVISGITGVPVVIHGADSAAIGAAKLAWRPSQPSPSAHSQKMLRPDASIVGSYRELAQTHDAAAAAVLGSAS